MSPITHMLTPPKPPEWRGPSSVHVLADDTPKDDPINERASSWKPWELLTASMSLRPAFKRARGCWDVRRAG